MGEKVVLGLHCIFPELGNGVPTEWVWKRDDRQNAIAKCNSCDYVTPHLHLMKDHVNVKHKGILLRCNLCPKAFLKLKPLREHRSKAHQKGLMECNLQGCGYKSVLAEKMVKHYSANHVVPCPPEYQPINPLIPADFTRPREVKPPKPKRPTFTRSCQKYDRTTYSGLVKKEGDYYVCAECNDFSSRARSSVRNHLNEFHLNISMKCYLCSYSSVNDSTLYCHLKQVHKLKAEKCTVSGCTYKTIHAPRLEMHLLNIHKLETRPFPSSSVNVNSVTSEEIKCSESQCDFKTCEESDLEEHLKHAHCLETEECIIPDCNYKTIRSEKMQSHLLDVHNARYDESQHALVIAN